MRRLRIVNGIGGYPRAPNAHQVLTSRDRHVVTWPLIQPVDPKASVIGKKCWFSRRPMSIPSYISLRVAQ